MLDYIWAGMILIGILSAAFTGHMADVTNGAISSAREAVSTALTMLGVISLWTGLMKIGEKAGIVSSMCRKITPFLSRLFPSVHSYPLLPAGLANIILPAEVCSTLVTITLIVCPMKRLPSSTTIMVPSSRYATA